MKNLSDYAVAHLFSKSCPDRGGELLFDAKLNFVSLSD